MLHSIKMPNCEPQISKVFAIVRLTLAFGLCNDPSSIPGNIGSKENISRLFLEHFSQHGYSEAGVWLWQKPVAIVKPLMQLLKIPLNQKHDILIGFDEDIQLEKSFRYGHFCYTDLPSSPALDLVKTLMVNFYERILRIKEGIPANALHEIHSFNRATILKAYNDANPDLLVCPGCDGSPPTLDEDAKFSHVDADHFFPKSKYPFLTVHPLNLTPYCLECNTKYKKAKDALEAAGVTSLTDIYHPYFCPAKEEITVVIERNQINGELLLHLSAEQNDASCAARLNSLIYILDLEYRWQLLLKKKRLQWELEYTLANSAAFYEEDTGSFRGGYDDEWFSYKLDIQLESWKGFIGKRELQIPSIAYARWVSVDAQACSAWRLKMLKLLEAPNKEYDFDTGQVRLKRL